MTMIAVIGAGYGDEGKGLATDFFASRNRCGTTWVVRGNGGAQAGHTVVTPDGQRHVFGHFGAGSFLHGVNTYLAENFLVNPLVLDQEVKKFPGTKPYIVCHRNAKVTTIFDMAINSILEISRGNRAHGSCGMGINETVTRDAAGFELRASDLGLITLEHIVRQIKNVWVPQRLDQLGLDRSKISTDAGQYFDILKLSDPVKIAHDLRILALKNMQISSNFKVLAGERVVYEGAQGLMLDEFLGKFPHVTRSVTGLASAVKAAAEIGIKQVKPVYMTRCYATRHGAGPLKFDGEKFCNTDITDLTNVHNTWQGAMRFAPLDLVSMRTIVERDIQRAWSVAQLFGIEILVPEIAVTCLDQVGETVTINSESCSEDVLTADVAEYIAENVELRLAFQSWGPTRNDVRVQ